MAWIETAPIASPVDLRERAWNYFLGKVGVGAPESELNIYGCTQSIEETGGMASEIRSLSDDAESPAFPCILCCNPGMDNEYCQPWIHHRIGQTGRYLLYDVGVQVVLPESNQNGCASGFETWTSNEIDAALGESIHGYNWLAEQSMNTQLTFWLPEIVVASTTFEPIRETQEGAHEWIEEIMENTFGYTCTEIPNQNIGWEVEYCAFEFTNDKRSEYELDWFFLSFVVRNQCQGSSRFWGQTRGFARYWGPWTISAYAGAAGTPTGLAFLVDHEALHVFGATDEYAASDDGCGREWGFLRVPNNNHVDCGSEQCLMKNTAARLCQWTQGQIGWWDSDGDGIPDPEDLPGSWWTGVIGGGGGSAPDLHSGEVVDFWGTAADWRRRVAMTDRILDYGLSRYNFLDHNGRDIEQPSTSWRYTTNGGNPHNITPIHTDSDDASIKSISITEVPGVGRHFRFSLLYDDQSAMLNVRVRVRLSGSTETTYFVLGPEYYNRTNVGNVQYLTPITKDFSVDGPGVYEYEALLSDLEGEHNTWFFGSFTSSGSTGVPEMEEKAAVTMIAFPNPSHANVRWRIAMDRVPNVEVQLRVLDVQGRQIRSWSIDASKIGETELEILWDGKDNSARPVASGTYYLDVQGAREVRGSRSVTILR